MEKPPSRQTLRVHNQAETRAHTEPASAAYIAPRRHACSAPLVMQIAAGAYAATATQCKFIACFQLIPTKGRNREHV